MPYTPPTRCETLNIRNNFNEIKASSICQNYCLGLLL